MMNEQTAWSKRPEELDHYWLNNPELPDYRYQMLLLIEKELRENPKSTIMDCGCGTGLIFEYLDDELKDRYYGCDFTHEMIEYCKHKYPAHADRFMRVDLTSMSLEEFNFFMGKNVYVTQNVIQHILLYQRAIESIVECADTIIMCERTHDMPTCIAGYEPAYRWRFNVLDLYDTLKFFTKEREYKGDVEIMGQPLTTDKDVKAVTIFRVRKHVEWKVSDAEHDFYVEEYFPRQKTMIREFGIRPRKRDIIIRFLKNLLPIY